MDEHHGNLITSAAEELIGGVFWGLLIDHFDCVVHSVCAMKQFRIWEREEEKNMWGRDNGGEERKKGREEAEKKRELGKEKGGDREKGGAQETEKKR